MENAGFLTGVYILLVTALVDLCYSVISVCYRLAKAKEEALKYEVCSDNIPMFTLHNLLWGVLVNVKKFISQGNGVVAISKGDGYVVKFWRYSGPASEEVDWSQFPCWLWRPGQLYKLVVTGRVCRITKLKES